MTSQITNLAPVIFLDEIPDEILIPKKFGIAEQIKQQRGKQAQNIYRIEQQNSSPLSSSITSLQEPEMDELMRFIDIYMLRCLSLINSYDTVLSVQLKDPNQTLPNPSLRIKNLCNSMSSVNILKKSEEDFSIRIDSMIPLDFLRNGLKAGNPLLVQTELQAKMNEAKETSKFPGTLAANVLTFKYLLTIDVNKKYFRFKSDKSKETEHLELYKVNMIEQPPNWSQFDYDQISLDMLLNRRQPPLRSKTRYLNSRAIFDRLYLYFNHVLKFDFPAKQNSQQVINKSVSSMSKSSKESKGSKGSKANGKSNKRSHQSNDINQVGTIGDLNSDSRTCILKNNQLIITFKLDNSFKLFRHLNICLIINIGIKHDSEERLNEFINESIVKLMRKFNRDGDQHMPNLDTYKSCLNRIFKSEHLPFYLSPAFIHYWSIDLRQTKNNLMKYLIYAHSKPASFRMNETVLSGEDRISRYGLDYNHIVFDSKAVIYTFFKSLQNFLYHSFNTFVINNKMADVMNDLNNSLQYELEDLTANMFLDALVTMEKQHLSCEVDSLFDILWSCLIKVRVYFFEKNQVPDPFRIEPNVMPSFFLRLGGFFSLKSTYNCKDKSSLNELRTAFDNCLKLFFKTIAGNELVPLTDDDEKTMDDLNELLSVGNGNVDGLEGENKSLVKSIDDEENPRVIRNLRKPSASRRSTHGSLELNLLELSGFFNRD